MNLYVTRLCNSSTCNSAAFRFLLEAMFKQAQQQHHLRGRCFPLEVFVKRAQQQNYF